MLYFFFENLNNLILVVEWLWYGVAHIYFCLRQLYGKGGGVIINMKKMTSMCGFFFLIQLFYSLWVLFYEAIIFFTPPLIEYFVFTCSKFSRLFAILKWFCLCLVLLGTNEAKYTHTHLKENILDTVSKLFYFNFSIND